MGTYQQKVDIHWNQVEVADALEDVLKAPKQAAPADSVLWEPPNRREMEVARAD